MMNKKAIIMALTAALFLAVLSAGAALAQDNLVIIGVLAKRGKERCLEKWSATADYLTGKIPGKHFVIMPLSFEDVYSAVEKRRVDFVVANSSFYVELEAWYGVSRIATLKNSRLGKAITMFGGVIFCRADNPEINSLADLKGKRFMAANKTSFGGWRMAWRKLKERGINPESDFADLMFSGTHDGVVYAVRDGEVEAGTVRTDTLERMAAEGKIDIKDFKIINRIEDDFPFVHSTRLYPEWPFAKLKHTPNDLAEKVSAALLAMSTESKAARDAKCAGWTVPLNYQPVHECLKELRLGPYEDYGKVTFGDVMRLYWYWFAAGAALLVFIFLAAIYVIRLNRRLSKYKLDLERKRAQEIITRKSIEQEALLANMPACVFFKDARGRYVTVNEAFYNMLPSGCEDVVGKRDRDLFPASRASKAESEDRDVMETGEIRTTEQTMRARDGKRIETLTKTIPVRDEFGKVTGVVGIVIDITERKRAEEEIRQAREKAETISRELAEKVNELERFNHLAVGREMKMIELKRQVNSLRSELGKEPVHDLSFDETESGNTLE